MPQIFRGRYTVQTDEPLAVFLTGMQRGQFETIHVNTPRFGLTHAFEPVPVIGSLDSAQGRIARQEASPTPIS